MGTTFGKAFFLNSATPENIQLKSVHYLILFFFIITIISTFFALVFTFKNGSSDTRSIAFYVVYLVSLIFLIGMSGFGSFINVAIGLLLFIFGVFYTIEMVYFQDTYGSQFLILSFFTVVLLILYRSSGKIPEGSSFGRRRKYRRFNK
jgi:hypothetical protein